jgi:hypothetical protein
VNNDLCLLSNSEYFIVMIEEKLQFNPPKLTAFFNSNTKVSIFAIHPLKFQFFAI